MFYNLWCFIVDWTIAFVYLVLYLGMSVIMALKIVNFSFSRLLTGATLLLGVFYQVQAESLQSDTVLLSDNHFYYRVPPTAVNNLNVGDILAAPCLPESTIASAEITSGKLPQGLSLFPNGLIVVNQSDKLKEGSYPLTITTTDARNQKIVTELALKITSPSKESDNEAIYKMESNSVINDLSEGEVLAHPIDQDGTIKFAKYIMGNLPPGTQLSSDGKIVVTNPKLLIPSTYNAGIVTVDQLGGVTFFMVSVPLKAGSAAAERQ